MKRILLLSLFAAFSFVLLHAKEAPNGYYIQKYCVSMDVHPDNTYSVQEILAVFYTETSHGFFRDIPNNVWVKRDISETQDGSETVMKHYSVDIADVSVQGANYQLNEYDGNHELKIGSSDIEVEGLHYYIINYTLKVPSDRVPQSDIFFQSVLGSGWNCDVDTFHFSVQFDTPLPESAVKNVQLYAGPEGDHTNQADRYLRFNEDYTEMLGSIFGIPAYNGVTIWMPLPEGYFKSTEPWQINAFWICFGIAILLFVYVIGREFISDRNVTKVISFHPPKGMSSADVGTLIDGSVDERDILSLIPWFASKGYLSIDNTGKHPVLKKNADLPDDAPKYQKLFFKGLFPNAKNTKFDTGAKSSSVFGDAWLSCESQLKNSFKDKLDKADYKTLVILCIAIFFASLAICFGSTDPDSWVHGGVTTVYFVALSTFMLLVMTGISRFVMRCLAGVGIAFGTMMYLACYSDAIIDTFVPVEYFHVLVIVAGAASVLAVQLTYMTEYRRDVLGEILGLEEFIRTAEKDQLEKLQAEDEKYFYNILPYAMCFGLAERWEKKFKDIHVKPSDNFISPISNGLIVGGMANCLANQMFTKEMKTGINIEKASRASTARSSSSGSSYRSSSSFSSGSHGYSGGGFGGGGGGRW